MSDWVELGCTQNILFSDFLTKTQSADKETSPAHFHHQAGLVLLFNKLGRTGDTDALFLWITSVVNVSRTGRTNRK